MAPNNKQEISCSPNFKLSYSYFQLIFYESSNDDQIRTIMSEAAINKLRQLGYAFNAEGELRKVDMKLKEITAEPFQFDVYGNNEKNQAHYDELAEQIPEVVYDLLEKCGLTRTFIPKDVPKENATFIFTQPEVLHRSKKMLVLIHGSGFVRAGQWARSLIINNSLDHGTQIPYIKRAQEHGFDILVMNTNDNYRLINGTRKSISQLGSPLEHAQYVWKNFVIQSEPDSVAVVAHSYGGCIVMDLVKRYPEFFEEKVFAIALTDSVHSSLPKKSTSFLKNITYNWVASSEVLDKVVSTSETDVRKISSGHTKHEWTSWSAFQSVFEFLEKMYESRKCGKKNKKSKLDSFT